MNKELKTMILHPSVKLKVENPRFPIVLFQLDATGGQTLLYSAFVKMTNATLDGLRTMAAEEGETDAEMLEETRDAANRAMRRGDFRAVTVCLMPAWVDVMDLDLPRLTAEGRTGVMIAEYSAALGRWFFHFGVLARADTPMGWKFDPTAIPPDSRMPAGGVWPALT